LTSSVEVDYVTKTLGAGVVGAVGILIRDLYDRRSEMGRRSFVQAEELDDFLRRKRYDASGQTETAG
jgi:hypothetical protein